jgi:hypothetical protein
MKFVPLVFLALGLTVPSARTQDPTPKEVPETDPKGLLEEGDTTLEEEAPEIPMPLPPASEDQAAKEILDLFKSVDKELERIDNMLFDLGAGERPLEGSVDSGLGALLDLTRDTSRSVVDDINRILELAEQMSQSSSSSSCSQGQKQKSGQNTDQQGKPDNQEKGGQDQEGAKPDEPGEKKPEDGQGEPKSPKESDAEGQNSPKESGEQHPTGAGSQADQTERWGELPERVRETFRNQGGDAAPLYYRDWIDSYYRHLSREDS